MTAQADLAGAAEDMSECSTHTFARGQKTPQTLSVSHQAEGAVPGQQQGVWASLPHVPSAQLEMP